MILRANGSLDHLQVVRYRSTYNCLRGLAPDYLTNLCVRVAMVDGRSRLRSSDDRQLLVPRTHTATLGHLMTSILERSYLLHFLIQRSHWQRLGRCWNHFCFDWQMWYLCRGTVAHTFETFVNGHLKCLLLLLYCYYTCDMFSCVSMWVDACKMCCCCLFSVCMQSIVSY